MENNLDLSGLDSNEIKESFKKFLSTKEEFKDYDFNASNINALLSLLSYHTYFNNFYTNMTFNDSFLDTAVKRSSVVSRAKELNYIPHGKLSSRATVSLRVLPASHTDLREIYVDKLSKWTGTNNEGEFNFINMKEFVLSRQVSPEGEVYFEARGIELINGKRMYYDYLYEGDQTFFVIPNKDVDTSLVRVFVKDSETTGTWVEYKQSTNVVSELDETKKFFLQENYNGYMEVYFGDDMFGDRLKPGNLVRVEYILGKGLSANGCNHFVLNNKPILGKYQVIVDTASFGGSNVEDIESIRRNAPKSFESQNRAVTVNDYVITIKQFFSDIRAISVWGGEDHPTPVYGRVLISIIPNTKKYLSINEMEYIENKLSAESSVVGIKPLLVQPTYISVVPDFTIILKDALVYSENEVREKIKDVLYRYINVDQRGFDSLVSLSKVSHLIHSEIDGIEKVDVNIRLTQEINPSLGNRQAFKISFDNDIESGSVQTTWFQVENYDLNVRIRDNGYSKLVLVDTNNDVVLDVGTVDYKNGIIEIYDNFIYKSFNGTMLQLFITTTQPFIQTKKQDVLFLNKEDVTVQFEIL